MLYLESLSKLHATTSAGIKDLRAAMPQHAARMDTSLLKYWHGVHQPRIEQIQEARQRRMSFKQQLVSLAEGGKIAVIESGRDCDCVEYDGRVHIIDATLEAFNTLDDSIGHWADGPYHLSLERPSMAERIQYESRDLVMEAHEDGHPHVIYSRFGG
jgi:uncharacterized protein YjhX (UPF0386 family)